MTFQRKLDNLDLNDTRVSFLISAADCRQRRPGAVFSQSKKETNPEKIDKEYAAFLSDLGVKTEDDGKAESTYVPPMGDLSKCFKDSDIKSKSSAPLMLTNGSSAPGAASAHARAISNPQMAGGMLQV